MEQINNIQLSDPLIYPKAEVLKEILGASYSAYLKLLHLFESMGLTHEWRYYKDGKAWLCKVQRKTKTIVWMSAWKGYMKATIYFPEKHTGGIYELALSEEEKARIKSGKNVGKSKPCMFDVKTDAVIASIAEVIRYKIRIK
ncbi:DUF3788 domain-containing protein [candidate division KSB1 bacterium]|nr:DUF3788 domain-containing protein [candidate division KSB1 bacterium]